MTSPSWNDSPAIQTHKLQEGLLANNLLLNRTSAPVVGSGDSGIFENQDSQVVVDLNVTAVVTPAAQGSTPASIVFFLDRIGIDGVAYRLWTSSTLTAAGPLTVSVGPGLEVPKLPAGDLLLGWTVAGSSPSVTFSASVIGRH